MGDVKAQVDGKIAGKKVVIFAKTHCPKCKKARAKLESDKYLGNILSPDDYDVVLIEDDPDCAQIQDYLKELTGARTVPRVFINQKFVGGCDDILAKDDSGELTTLLG